MRRLSPLLLLLGVASLATANKKADIFNKLAKEQQPHRDGEGMDAVTAEKMTGEEQHRDLRDLQLIWSSYFSPSMTPETPEEVDTTSIILDGVLDEADDPSLLSEALTNPLVPETLIPSLVTSCPGIELKAPRTIRAGRQVSAGRRVYMVAKLTSYWDMAGGLRDGGLILTLPEGLKYVGAVLSPMAPGYAIHPDLSGQTVAWTALDLAAGKSFKFRLELKVLPGGPATRTLTVQATVDGSTCGRSAAVELLVKPTEVSMASTTEEATSPPTHAPTPSTPTEAPTAIITDPAVVAPVAPGTTDESFTQAQVADADAIKTGIKGDPFQVIATSGANLNMEQLVGENSCWPLDAEELVDAIENQNCELVMISNGEPGAYALEEDIKVTRHVRVMGNPAVLPQIDAEEAERAFTVGVGGFLELQFVRVRGGGGITRERYFLEGLGTEVAEVRGGGVAVEPGALGASFVGVTFIAVASDLESIQGAIDDTLAFVGGRLYGGHVFVAAGTVTFFGCNFWDSGLLLPLTDQITIGGDVLVVAGNVFFTGCTFTATLLFGNFGGIGFNVAVLGGNAVFTFCVIQAQGVAQSANGAGQVLFVGGGTMIVTGMDFRFASAILFFSGIGDFFVGGGVMIFTGVTIEKTYPILAAYGAGFYLAVGGGVMVETGVSYVQWNCPAHLGLTGASIFMGAGTSIHVGVPASFYGTTVLVTGNGGFSYNGAGYSLWLGSPIAVFLATFAFFGIGGLVSQPAGFMVYLGCPAFTPAALSYFAGLGVVMYLGMGGAVIGGSPVFAPAFKFKSNPDGTADYYINGNPDASGKGIGYYSRDVTNEFPAVRALSAEANTTVRALSAEDNFHAAVRVLRAERRLSVSAISDLTAAFFDADSSGSSRFLGADLKVTPKLDFANNEMVKSLSSWVPEGIMAGAKDIMAMGSGGVTERGTSLLRMDSADVDYCGFCGEGDVTGDSADACEKFASCKELEQDVPDAMGAAFHPDEVKFDPWHIVMATFNPTTEKGQKVEPDDLRDAFRSYFIESETNGVSVSAFADEVDPLMQQVVPTLAGPKLSALVDATFPTSTPLKVVFVVNDAAQAQSIKAALEDHESEMYGEMEEWVQDFLRMDGVSVGALDGGIEKIVSIPAYNTPEFSTAFAKEASAAAGTNSVRLIDGEHTGLPLFHAAVGETYTVLLANFPKGVPLTLQLIGSQEVDGVSKQTATAVSSVKTDRNGAASVTWTVPADQPLGDCYLKATDSTGIIFGMTPMLELAAAPKRKLWGPHMHI